jgi:acetyl-CoA C-acetyltransferase
VLVGVVGLGVVVVVLLVGLGGVGLGWWGVVGVDPDKVNVNGGAIALGHPIGMSGARLVLHLALELKRRGGGTGVASLCGGGGQGDALVVRVPKR